MIDPTPLRKEIENAIERLVQQILALLPKERAAHVARERDATARMSQATGPAAKPLFSEAVRRRVIPVPPTSLFVPKQKQPPLPEKIAEKITRELQAHAEGYGFQDLCKGVRLSPELVGPVLQQLASQQRVRTIEQDGATIYKRPRFEPVRRPAKQ